MPAAFKIKNVFLVISLLFLSIVSCNNKKDNWKLVWADEFDYTGLPDSTKWDYNVGGKGWGNRELQYYTYADTNNAVVRNGVLNITALKQIKDSNQYTSARLVTKGKQSFQYGKIEVRAKLPSGRGVWPAIWMLGDNIDSVNWPACGEIDIMEHVGFKKDSIFGSIHTKTFNHILGTQVTKGIFVNDPYDTFHIYSIEWTPEKIDFFLDNKQYLEFVNMHKTTDEWPFGQPFFIILNLAIGGNWGGQHGVDNLIFPTTMQIDYVRVYQNQY